MIHCFKLFIPVCCFIACSSKQPVQSIAARDTSIETITQPVKDSFIRGKIIPQVTCTNDATQSYALYIPAIADATPMPVVYCFDPHGDGALPLNNYKALADKYHFILAGSNNSKNGNDWNTAQQIWTVLFNDTKNRLPIDESRMYTCGFSGGAKVAGFIATHNTGIKGVIAAGAPLPEDQSVANFPFSFTGMAGRGDMNMTDLVALNNALDKTTTTHRLMLFNGKHAWPPPAVMNTAFAGLELDAMRSKRIDKDDSLINVVAATMKAETDNEIAAHNFTAAQQTCLVAINLLNGFNSVADAFVQKENAIIANPVYQQQVQEAQLLFVAEQQQKQTFQQQFQQGDMQYWTTTISNLEEKAKASTAEGAMYQRLLAYLSLAFYSISNNLIQSNQNEDAAYFVTLYKMVDATNSEAWYFSAVLHARAQDAKGAEADLIKAANYGFTDTARLLQQPDFRALGAQLNIGLAEQNMKKEMLP